MGGGETSCRGHGYAQRKAKGGGDDVVRMAKTVTDDVDVHV